MASKAFNIAELSLGTLATLVFFVLGFIATFRPRAWIRDVRLNDWAPWNRAFADESDPLQVGFMVFWGVLCMFLTGIGFFGLSGLLLKAVAHS